MLKNDFDCSSEISGLMSRTAGASTHKRNLLVDMAFTSKSNQQSCQTWKRVSLKWESRARGICYHFKREFLCPFLLYGVFFKKFQTVEKRACWLLIATQTPLKTFSLA